MPTYLKEGENQVYSFTIILRPSKSQIFHNIDRRKRATTIKRLFFSTNQIIFEVQAQFALYPCLNFYLVMIQYPE